MREVKCPSCGTVVQDLVVTKLFGCFTVPCNHRVVAWRNADTHEVTLELCDG